MRTNVLRIKVLILNCKELYVFNTYSNGRVSFYDHPFNPLPCNVSCVFLSFELIMCVHFEEKLEVSVVRTIIY